MDSVVIKTNLNHFVGPVDSLGGCSHAPILLTATAINKHLIAHGLNHIDVELLRVRHVLVRMAVLDVMNVFRANAQGYVFILRVLESIADGLRQRQTNPARIELHGTRIFKTTLDKVHGRAADKSCHE